MHAGDAFLLLDKSVDDHLWIVVSDPIKDKNKVLIVSMTTAAPHKEAVCLIQPGEHPWVRHDTCVSYDNARLVSLQQLLALKDTGMLDMQEPCSNLLLKRIRDAAGDSVDLPMEMAEILSEQELVDF